MLFYPLALLATVAGAYQLMALAACITWKLRSRPAAPNPPTNQPGISILKPVRGLDPHLEEAIASQAVQDYPQFEILFGVSDPDDEAIPVIQRAAAAHPQCHIRWIQATAKAPNGKVGTLIDLARQARYPLLLVSDADIRVPAGYLSAVAAPLADPANGLVTCLYNGEGDSLPAWFEALGVVTDFAPSALVAPFVGVNEFAFGSTMIFRASDLERIGGFRPIGDYIADDYQLGKRIHMLGLRCVLSEVVVDTQLGAGSWRDVWRHQVRWARTIRVSRFDGYVGLPVTHASLCALVCAAAGFWPLALGLMTVRLLTALYAAVGVLGNRKVIAWFWAIPLRDLYASAVWLTGLFGDFVWWRGQRMRLGKDGRITG